MMAFYRLVVAIIITGVIDSVLSKYYNKYNYNSYSGNSYNGKQRYAYYGYANCKPASCLDIYNDDCRSLSGEYTIYSGNQALRVYCSFEEDYVYTFISRTSSGTTFNISTLYSTSEFVQVRILDSSDVQSIAIMENLSTHPGVDLAIELGSTPSNYQGPSTSSFGGPNNPNTELFPYLFLGFLPISLTNALTTQGYRAAGIDFTFNNCDANPNSYMAFYFDPDFGSFSRVGNTNTFMQQWITNSIPLPLPEYMPEHYFMKFEHHMGGCGGFMSSQAANVLAALGLAQALPEGDCTEPTCSSAD